MDTVYENYKNEIKAIFNFEHNFDECINLFEELSKKTKIDKEKDSIPPEHIELEYRIDVDTVTERWFKNLVRLTDIETEDETCEAKLGSIRKYHLIWNEIKYKNIVCTDPKFFNYRYRIYKDGNIEKIKKILVKKWTDSMNWISIFLSREIEIDQLPTQDQAPSRVLRKTCLIPELGLKIDATETKQSSNPSLQYRIEFEFISENYNLLKQSKREICNFIKKIISCSMDSPLYFTKFNKSTIKWILSRDYSIFNFDNRIYQRPSTLLKTNMKELISSYYVTPKLNGERRFLIIFYSRVFSIDLKGNIRYVKTIEDPKEENDYRVTVLDSEYLNDRYFIIDCLIYKDKENIDISLQNRLKLTDSLPFIQKPYIYIDPFIRISFLDLYREWGKKMDIDGLIFSNDKYNKPCYKWKKENTVDLLFNKKDNTFNTNDNYSISYSKIYNPNNIQLIDRNIYEISITRKNIFQILKERNDKPKPNSYKIIQDNRSKMIVTENHFKGREFLFMRCYHNMIKRIIYESSPHHLRILDIGSGQGGDLSKWKKISPIEIVSIEKDLFKIEEMKKRNEAFGLNLHTIDKKLSDIDFCQRTTYELISLFFCMNGFDQTDFKSLFNIISDAKQNNCIRIVGSFLDSSKIKYKKTDFYEISDLNNDYYEINLFHTRIHLSEKKLSISYIDSFFRSLGYFPSIISYANFMRYGMADPEFDISSMYCFFEYRLIPFEWYSRYIYSNRIINSKNYRYIIELDTLNRVRKITINNKESLYSLIVFETEIENNISQKICDNEIIFESFLRQNL